MTISWIQTQYILLLDEQVLTNFLCIKRVRLNWNFIVNDVQSATYSSHEAPCPARDLFPWLNTRVKVHIPLWTIREYPKRHFRYLWDSGDTFLPLCILPWHFSCTFNCVHDRSLVRWRDGTPHPLIIHWKWWKQFYHNRKCSYGFAFWTPIEDASYHVWLLSRLTAKDVLQILSPRLVKGISVIKSSVIWWAKGSNYLISSGT